MKKEIASTLLAVSLLAATTAPVFAEETSQSNMTVQSSTSSSSTQTVDPASLIYKLNELLTELKTSFTFNDKAKADRLLAKAEQKLTELEALNQTGNTAYNEKFIQAINEALDKAQEALKQAQKAAGDEQKSKEAVTEGSNKQASETNAADDTEKTAEKVEKHSLTVLKALLANAPEGAKKGIENAIAKQEAKLKEKADKAAEKVNKQAAKQAAKAEVEHSTVPAPGVIEPVNATQTKTSEQAANSATTTAAQNATSETSGQVSTQTSAASTTVTAKSGAITEVPALDEAGVKVKQNNGLHLGQYKDHNEKTDKTNENNKQQHGKQE